MTIARAIERPADMPLAAGAVDCQVVPLLILYSTAPCPLLAKIVIVPSTTPQSVIYKHIDNSCDLLMNHPDTVVGHLNHERSVTNDYRGRVLFELLQNAVDRAEEKIWIEFNREKRTLVVANDGKPFAFKARDGEPRSDFAAICAIDTSNKAMGKSIGNKGVGFKSVWSLTESVQVKTREGVHQWGFRLRWPFHSGFLDSWSDDKQVTKIKRCLLDAELEERHRGKAPSFYFPEFIAVPSWRFGDAITVIELENLSDDACDQVEELINGENDIKKDKVKILKRFLVYENSNYFTSH